MKERPILFSAPMVQALLNGSKTQTRRVIKPQPPAVFCKGDVAAITNGTRWAFSRLPERIAHPPGLHEGILCPYGQPGDRLWVRETWMPDAPHDGTWASTQFYGCKNSPLSDIPERFREAKHCIHRASWDGPPMVGWKPSIHMPRWASRITLEITGVRVERLQDISEADAIAEGCRPEPGLRGDDDMAVNTAIQAIERRTGKIGCSAPVARYMVLWESINGPDSWSANPWVWAVSFKRLEQPA